MSKQRGQYQYTGRLGTTVGYSQRYAKDRYLRSVSEGQSERVKTSPNYENLRLYNEEFKHVAEFSSLVFRNMPDRFSTMLKPHRVAELNKQLLPLLKLSGNEYGTRDIVNGDYNQLILSYLASLRKIETSSFLGVVSSLFYQYDEDNDITQIFFRMQMDDSIVRIAKSLHIDSIQVSLYSIVSFPSQFGGSIYLPPTFEVKYENYSVIDIDYGVGDIDSTIFQMDGRYVNAFYLCVLKFFTTYNGLLPTPHVLNTYSTFISLLQE